MNIKMKYGIKKEVEYDFEKAVEKSVEELGKEGFGILTQIDVKATLKKKLDVEFEDYIILGACNPPFAYKSLIAEIDLGLLLPCNVIVYRKEGKTFVNAIRPSIAMSFVDNKELENIAKEIETKLQKVIDSI
ncbi:MAG: DUF302 domain-containing protein [Candidatus Woesearchaeota archaeon]|jgi:uncharacterized protein (DUF302 family)|nr:DUF302 domain-containing protein [Candidatus Woesearchaeota archaeon]